MFSAYSVFFIDYVFWADHEHVFLANACVFYIFIIRYCIFSAYYDMIYWSWKDLFASYIKFCIFAIHGGHGMVEHSLRILEF